MNGPESDRPMSDNNCIPPPAATQQVKRKRFMDVRINADDQSSRRIIIYSSIIIAAIVVVSLLAEFAIPKSRVQVQQMDSLVGTGLEGCGAGLTLSDSKLVCGGYSPVTIGQYVSGLGRMNQFVAFYLVVDLQDSLFEDLNESVYVTVYRTQRYTTASGVVGINVMQVVKEGEVILDSYSFYQTYFYLNFVNRVTAGDEFFWQIELQLGSQIPYESYSLNTYTINPQFSIFCVTLRAVFFGLSCLFLLITWKRYAKADSQLILPEQHIIFVISLFTLGYNDPFYIITILYPNVFTALLSTLLLWNFVTGIFIVWVIFLQRIRSQQASIQTKLLNRQNLSFVLVFYFINLSYQIALSLYQTYDRPFINPAYTQNLYLSITSFFSLIVFLVAIGYVFVLYSELWVKRASLLWRSSVFMNISFFFFIVMAFLLMVGGYNVFQYSSKILLFTVTFTNIYSFYLQYLYAPVNAFQEQQKDQNQSKQPSFIIFDDRDISIDLQKDHFWDIKDSAFGNAEEKQHQNAGISYIGEHIKQGSKIVTDVGEQSSK